MAFLALFALDSFDGRPILTVLPGFAVHLIPAMTVGLVVAAGWRFPRFGAAGFIGLAVAYAAMVPNRPDWILAIAGPLVVVALLFAFSARLRQPRSDQRHA